MAENQSSIISALHRLERAGSEHSASTAKLLHAAAVLSDVVIGLLPRVAEDVEMPRRYSVGILDTAYSRGDRELLGVLVLPDQLGPVDETRESALVLAQDVASGWLGELAAWMEEHSAQDAEAVATLERAAAGLRSEPRTQGAYFSIAASKLADIADIIGVDVDDVRKNVIDYDWGNATDHRAWLDSAPAQEIANWLRDIDR